MADLKSSPRWPRGSSTTASKAKESLRARARYRSRLSTPKGPVRHLGGRKLRGTSHRLEFGNWRLEVDMKTLALTVGIVGLTAVAMAAMQAQAPSAAPAFEVVSVKPSAPNPSSPLGMIPMVLPA